MELKDVFPLAEVDTILELLVPDALSASGAGPGVTHNRFHYNFLVLKQLTILADVFNVKDAHGTDLFQLLCLIAANITQLDIWQ